MSASIIGLSMLYLHVSRNLTLRREEAGESDTIVPDMKANREACLIPVAHGSIIVPLSERYLIINVT